MTSNSICLASFIIIRCREFKLGFFLVPQYMSNELNFQNIELAAVKSEHFCPPEVPRCSVLI